MIYKIHETLDLHEKENNTTFVTTAIDYPNALPHIGTAFEKIGADVYARFRRSQGREVHFSMGNDENTIKVKKVVDALGDTTVQDYVNKMATDFKAVWNALDISFDDFIQTSEERHRIGVQKFLTAVQAAGYIEKRPYKALYCEGCEEFKSPNSLDYAKRCPNHLNTPLVVREEENYFFKLSEFKQKVLDLMFATPFITSYLSVEPKSRYNEVVNFVEAELTDISISRRNEGWGIPIPWDDTQATYVWFDALLNYLTTIGFGTDWEKFQKYWPAEVHFIGKDITRFHCALFPAMCMAYNEGCKVLGDPHKLDAYPIRVFVHGFVYQRKGNQVVKSSKSGDAISPLDLVNQFGSDAYRYYFISKLNYDGDGEYSLDHFREVYNSDLANALGNLVSRTVGMTLQYFEGKLPAGPTNLNSTMWLTPDVLCEYEKFIVEKCNYRGALELTWKIIAQANKYIEEMKPWELAKLDSNIPVGQVLRDLVASLRIVSLLTKPFIPKVSDKILSAFQFHERWSQEGTDWDYLKMLSENNFYGLESGVDFDRSALDNNEKYPPLFPRVKVQ